MAADTHDIDPTGAAGLAEFSACLRRVRAHADNISYRELEAWGKAHGSPLPRSTVVDVLAGRRLPRRPLLLALLRACGIDPDADRRWVDTWNRLSEQRSAGGVTPAVQPLGAVDEALAADLRTAGLLRIGANYLNELDWQALFAGSRELDVFVAYGQTWRNLHARHLHQLAGRPGTRIRVFLPDPDDPVTVAVLADRFATTPQELVRRVEATRTEFEALRQPGRGRVEVYYRPGDRVFSFYRLDGTAIVGFYSHSRNRVPSVPVFVCQAPGALYDFVADELRAIERQSRPV
jgi:hypothetical protein